MECSIAHCGRKVAAKGFCANHYRAMRLYGDPLGLKQKQHHGKTLKERFDLYVKRSEGCWPWLGYKDSNGYGRLNVNGIPQLASRVSYLLHYGDVPKGKSVCHKCDNPICVNPDHLFIGTQADNVADMHSKGRARKRAVSGEAHGNAILTEDDVRQILRSPLSVPELAVKFNMSRTTIYGVRKRKSWKHVSLE